MYKKYISLLVVLCLVLVGCSNAPESAEIEYTSTIDRLTKNNEISVLASTNSGDTSKDKRKDVVTNGQEPYAVILTCSDSRVVPEHIFNAGIGELLSLEPLVM